MKFLTCCRGARFAWSAIAVLASIDVNRAGFVGGSNS